VTCAGTKPSTTLVAAPPVATKFVVWKPETDSTTLSPAIVAAAAEREWGDDLRTCYAELLSRDPTANNTRLGLSFTVNESGRVVSMKVRGFGDTNLDACIEARSTEWKLPIPLDDDGEPTEADVSLELRFSPER
jgi:hypothetical protein